MLNNMISVIVPVYNVEKYLRKCLDSIVNQTFSNFEVILVNDGSTDTSGAICDEYVKKDARFFVIHRENGGLSAARNSGLLAAKGKYLNFIDSDDWIRAELLEQLINLLNSYEADISKCNFFSDEAANLNEQEEIRCYTSREYMIRYLNDESDSNSYFCGKLFKRDLFTNQCFPVGKTCEDMFLMPQIIKKATKIVVTNQKYYFYYRTRPTSIMNNPDNRIRNQVAIAEAFRTHYNIASNYYKEADVLILKRATTSSICAYCLLGNIKNIDDKSKEVMLENYQFIKEYYSNIKSNKEVPIWYKIGALVMLRYPNLFCKIVGRAMDGKYMLKFR